jgi:hypothetical protein
VPRARWAGSIRPTLSLAAGSMVDHGGLTVLFIQAEPRTSPPIRCFLLDSKSGRFGDVDSRLVQRMLRAENRRREKCSRLDGRG